MTKFIEYNPYPAGIKLLHNIELGNKSPSSWQSRTKGEMTYLDDTIIASYRAAMDRAAQKWQDPRVDKGGLTEEQFLAKKLRSDEEKNNVIEKFIDSAIMQKQA